MKIKHSTHSRTKIILALLSIVIVALLVGLLYYLQSQSSNPDTPNPINLNPASDSEKKAGSQAKTDTLNQNDTSTNSAKNTPSPESVKQDNLPIQMTASNQSDDIYQLRFLIDEVVVNGTCTLSLKKDAQVVTKSAAVQSLPQSSTCQGFDIPLEELTPGKWDLKLTVKGDNQSGETVTSIEVKS